MTVACGFGENGRGEEPQTPIDDREVKRVRFYGAKDLSLPMFTPRIEFLLGNPFDAEGMSIADAIEFHEAWLCIDCGFRSQGWDEGRYQEILAAAHRAKSCAIQAARRLVPELPLCELVEAIPVASTEAFWRLLESSALLESFEDEEVELVARVSKLHLTCMLLHKRFVAKYSGVLLRVMIDNPSVSIPLLLRASSLSGGERQKLYCPKGLTQVDLDNMVIAFLQDSESNSNYIAVLANRRAFSPLGLELSPKVLAAAEEAYEERTSALFSREGAGVGVEFGVEVRIDGELTSCRKCSFDGRVASYSYGRSWLKAYTDPASVLNNFAYVFAFVDGKGLIEASKPEHSEGSLLSIIGLHMDGEYPVSMHFKLEDMRQVGILGTYQSVLSRCGSRVEDAIEWFFNEYILREFGIEGFRIDLPVEPCTPLQKCELVGIQLERVLKTVSMLGRDGRVNARQFKHEVFGGFDAVPTLIGKEKYVYGCGEDFEAISRCLFSNQSLLAYVRDCDAEADSFFELMLENNLTLDMYDERYAAVLRDIIGRGFLALDPGGCIRPTNGAVLMARLWRDGSIPIHRASEGELAIVNALVDDGYLVKEGTFLSRQEADLMSFLFHNRKFPNAWALRNRYDHSADLGDDPFSDAHVRNYYRLLSLIIDVVLKLNDELRLNAGTDDGVEYVDQVLDSTGLDDLGPLEPPKLCLA